MQRQRPAPRAARGRGERERRSKDGPQHPAEMLEELVVARLEDPAVELEVGGEVGRLVVARPPPSRRRPPRSPRPPRPSPVWRPGERRAARCASRISVVSSYSFWSCSTRVRQLRTSGSTMFHSLRVRTRVPVLGRASTSPLAARTRTASLSTVRLTDRSDVRSSSGGSGSPGRSSPLTILQPDRVDDLAVEPAPRICYVSSSSSAVGSSGDRRRGHDGSRNHAQPIII